MQITVDEATVEFIQDYIDHVWSLEPDHDAKEKYQKGAYYNSAYQQENLLELIYRVLLLNRDKFSVGIEGESNE